MKLRVCAVWAGLGTSQWLEGRRKYQDSRRLSRFRGEGIRDLDPLGARGQMHLVGVVAVDGVGWRMRASVAAQQ